jgi:hypothetical protein
MKPEITAGQANGERSTGDRCPASAEPNTLFPGRHGYTGPKTGWFGLLHHTTLCEESHDVMERVAYVRDNKPDREVAVRLQNMIYLDGCPAVADYRALAADHEAKCRALDADYWTKRGLLGDDYWAKRRAHDADYEAKCGALAADYEAKRRALEADILHYIKAHIPDCAWDGIELRFPGAAP